MTGFPFTGKMHVSLPEMLVSATLDYNDLNFRSGEFGQCLDFTGTPNDFCECVLAEAMDEVVVEAYTS